MTSGWNPWRALRARPDIELIWADIPGDTRGAWFRFPDHRVIVLDARLGRRERSSVLTHELIHNERDLPADPDLPVQLRDKEEAIVHREVARRLIPVADLEAFIDRHAEFGEVTVHAVAQEFDVDHRLAAHALHLLSVGARTP